MRDGVNIVSGLRARLGSPGRDAVVLTVTFAAIALFIHLATAVIPTAIGAVTGSAEGPDLALANALVLNVALIIFGWRRYRDLTGELATRRAAEATALGLADRDPLTQCLNRRSIAAQCAMLAATTRERREALAFVMLDLDRFKQVNDTNGHAAGDALLCTAATRIRALLPAEALLARLGGDEFAAVIPCAAGQRAGIERLVESIIAAIAEPVTFEDIELETSISAGIVLAGSDCELDPQVQLHRADMAMYHAKRTGRNALAWFEASMESELKLRSAIESGIRRGIPAHEFVPHYEKQVDLETGEITGFEMLARWNSPTLGRITPDVFIPIAEELGLIADLSESLIGQALRDAQKWDPKLSLSVNISPVQLRDPWFAQKLLKLLVEANFPPARLEIEVTESCLHENVALVRSLITSLKNQGVRVSLDDFGTGYSSLSQLRSLPFDRIKIDRSFVMNLVGDKDNATIVRSIIALGEGLGLPITAEGIESEEVLAELRTYGKFNGQGYLYGFPENAETTAAELAQLDLLLEPAPVKTRARRSA
jgi:diguanylate cyclase (GGDEF)-like protein